MHKLSDETVQNYSVNVILTPMHINSMTDTGKRISSQDEVCLHSARRRTCMTKVCKIINTDRA